MGLPSLWRTTSQCNWVIRPSSKRIRHIGPQIELTKVLVDGQKEFNLLHHRGMDEYRGVRCHIIPCMVYDIG